MPSAEHFSPQFNLYHGSYHDFKNGELVDPKYDENYDEDTKEGLAFATDSPYYAGEYGDVHKVEPVDPSDLEAFHHDDAYDEETGKPFYTMYASKSGFRVVRPERRAPRK